MTDYPTEYAAWKIRRLEALQAPDGWLNIIARDWLSEGTVKIGAADDNDIILPTGPAYVGTLTQDADGGVTYAAADGSAPIKLELNKYKPPRFTAENLLLEVTTLNGENAVRVRDTASKAGEELGEIEYFDLDPSWRIEAKWVALEEAKNLSISTSKAIPTEVQATHKAVFDRDGVTYELLATHGTKESPQFVIRDLTSRDSTYGACRFVFGENVSENSIVLDFNKALNPPCAFTDFAVCPLPPAENVLPIRIEAGEKRLKD
ncbi:MULTISPECIES: DUF1684 domain-containing protein [unclassified Devosia]|uniref:DUF1684 domain-containing protein n=1 Tax=unclassified Devosia TaxID=196773 RepID=UPI00145E076C|nr:MULTISPECIES: DUF1684 domain-containing protein [unclassified Devosia]MBJ6986883.1 DUF1684 domain-containing protein [Devosia sp. MC521]QMW63912.1 DUF1684 domain-containing protein [Devosia sp. MC521]